MTRIAALSIRIADAFMFRAMDQLTRVGILEGLAGVPVGRWKKLSPPARGLAEAEKFFVARGQTINPRWFDLHDQGLYKTIFVAVFQITHAREHADEIAQDIVSGLSRSEDVEGGQLYDVGKKLRAMNDTSLDHAKGMMRQHAKHRAIPRVMRRREESLTMDTEDGDVVRDIPAERPAGSTIDSLIEHLSGERGGQLYRKLMQEMARRSPGQKGKLAIFDEIIKNPNITDVEIARILKPGIPDNTPGSWVQLGAATYVSKMRRQIIKDIKEILADTPGLLGDLTRDVEMQDELRDLGYGQSRWARKAQNLVRFLSPYR